ncbi:hypothetical protein Cob_v008873 [Colletotrichum orbiculare MAFF 240422]|uniref:Tim44-like domain-containing protein n=1 Tax=Colletotrichum orbiculare (strain 104-T / ATCC 96160 / CBS 514.97 / LARS 414 / MAFF 240422) TaxID=1213857 RepID=N4UQX3_COLOR|nr:hypothetical protein Cob_v008873 [Colletotrichum orbiculare MAFF 240422]
MFRTARPLLGTSRSAALLPQTLARAALPSTAKRIAPAAIATPASRRSYAYSPDTRTHGRMAKAMAKKSDKGYSAKEMAKAQRQAMTHILIPGTFVPLPFSLIDKSPKRLWEYTYARVWQKGKDLAAIIGAKISSMPSWITRPRMQLSRSTLIPTAKAMHQRLATALAAGDRETIREICTPRLAEALTATISRRNPNEKLLWELISYEGRPRLASHKMAFMPPVGKGPVVQQAVVGITSTQRLAKIDPKTGGFVTGSEKVQKRTEYIVLSRELEPSTWKPKDWLVWGNTKPTTLKEWRMEEKGVEQLERQEREKRIAARK